MKIIEYKEKTTVVLEENDILEVETLKGNPAVLQIKLKNDVMIVDELNIKEIERITMEKEQVKILKSQSCKCQRQSLKKCQS